MVAKLSKREKNVIEHDTFLLRENKHDYLENIYCIVIAILPILSIYDSGIPGMSIAEITLIFFSLISFFSKKRNEKNKLKTSIWLFFFLLIIVISLIDILINQSYFQTVAVRLIRFCFYIFCFTFTSRTFFSPSKTKKYISFIAILSIIFLLFQYGVFYMSGMFLRGYGNILSVRSQQYSAIDYKTLFSKSIFRPSSFFLEPSHLSQFLFIPLVLTLFSKEKRNIKFALFVSLGMILSTSLYGYALLAFIWGCYFVRLTIGKHGLRASFFFYIALAGLCFFVVMNLPVVKNALSRLDFKNLLSDSTYFLRFGGYEEYFKLSTFNVIFGNGFGYIYPLTYSNSILYLLMSCGVIGFIAFLYVLIKCYKYTINSSERMLLLCFILLLFGSSIIVSTSIIVIFSFILFDGSSMKKSC